ncbi:chromate transporter [Burkholderia plantarii]|uniref:Chromate transporter n=1 Tax=Burkholderia plantarii TaxID=41899 RepID=A0A0B6RZ11_BURPL|nr:chromate transporter [Burkholderia plantarii]AJK47354.1 chromate transporter [Burkholderia plantarii]
MNTTTDGAVASGERESLWSLFWIVAGVSAVSWGGLAMMAQLERHYVERTGRLDPAAYADLVALAWIVPGPVGCNVAIQLGQALRGRAGAWLAGIASVLPFFVPMTLFAIFYRAPAVRSLAAPMLLHAFGMVLAALIGVTWRRQIRTLATGPAERLVAAVATVLLMTAHRPGAFVAILAGAFAWGWFSSTARGAVPRLRPAGAERPVLLALALLVVLFALPLPDVVEAKLLWMRLAGAGMTLFGGGFSALPVLKALFVTPATGLSDSDFTLAFALSPVSPGPLLNVVPFLGYLMDGWRGALLGTAALFIPSGCLVVLAQRHLHRLRRNPRFEHGMRMLRAATTGFLAIAVVRILIGMPAVPGYWAIGALACLAFARFGVPVYAVYGTVAAGCGGWLLFAAH